MNTPNYPLYLNPNKQMRVNTGPTPDPLVKVFGPNVYYKIQYYNMDKHEMLERANRRINSEQPWPKFEYY